MKFNCILVLFFLIGVLAACKNNDNVFPKSQSSYLTVVNASTDTLNVYLNGTRQNNQSNLSPGGAIANLTVPAGNQNYQFKKGGAFSVLFSVALNLTDSTYNSLFVTGETPASAFSTNDDLPAASGSATSDTAYVRFVNASSNAGNLDVIISNSSSSTILSFKSIAFKSASSFSSVITGQNEVKVYQASTSVLLKDTTLTIEPNNDYTVFSKGLLNGTGNAVFNIKLLTN